MGAFIAIGLDLLVGLNSFGYFLNEKVPLATPLLGSPDGQPIDCITLINANLDSIDSKIGLLEYAELTLRLTFITAIKILFTIR